MINNIRNVVHSILAIVVNIVFGFFYNGKRRSVPKIKNEALLKSASDLAKTVRSGALTSTDLVQACIDRIKEVNGLLNAVVDERFEDALKEAKQIDLDIANGKYTEEDFAKKPFLGVPFTTKESIECKGMSFTLGVACRKDMKGDEDADVIGLMKEAGGILLAVTNIPELNLWQESRNMLFGNTCNPYDTTRTCGGSSGGEGCLIAACGSVVGVGSDIGGSIRMPAFFCGIYGHKPTTGLTPTKGVGRRTGLEKSMVSAGPMTKYAEDLRPMLQVLLGQKAKQLKLAEKPDLKSLKFFWAADNNEPRTSPPSEEVRDMMGKLVQRIGEEIGVEALEMHMPHFASSTKLWRYWMTREPSKFSREIKNRNGDASFFRELLLKLVGLSQHTFAAVFKLADDQIMPGVDAEWAEKTTEEMRTRLFEHLGDDGVLLFPSFPYPATYHYAAFLRPYNFSYQSVFNVLGVPVTQVPLGLSKEGLPMGVQVVARPNNDHLCITVAERLEVMFGGFVPPFPRD